MKLYIENNSGRDIIAEVENAAINGSNVNLSYYQIILDGKKALDGRVIDDYVLKDTEINIDEVSDIALSFNIFDRGTMDLILSAGDMMLSLE